MSLYCLSTAWGCWITATANLDISKLGWGDWLQTAIGCLAVTGSTLIAYFDRSIAQLSSGHLPGVETETTPTKTEP
jgi:hypothetical protein